jgi:hypothetical protein
MCSLPTIDAEHDAAFNSAFVCPTTFAIFFGKGMGDGGTLFIHRSQTLERVVVASVVAVVSPTGVSYVAVGFTWIVHAANPMQSTAAK